MPHHRCYGHNFIHHFHLDQLHSAEVLRESEFDFVWSCLFPLVSLAAGVVNCRLYTGMETTHLHRSDYLTGATLLHGSVADDFADLIGEPDDERIVRGLKSAYTKALFNSVVAVKQAREPDLTLDLLVSINRNASRPDEWRIIEEERIDLPTTLELIQMELLESAAFCGPDALPLLTAS